MSSLSEIEHQRRVSRIRKWAARIVFLIVLLLGGLLDREHFFAPSRQVRVETKASAPAHAKLFPGELRFDLKDRANLQIWQDSQQTTVPSLGETEVQMESSDASTPASVPFTLSTSSELRLAVANYQNIFDRYYVTVDTRASIKQRVDAGKKIPDDELKADRKQINAEILEAIKAYAASHGIDLVLDTDVIASGAPFTLYVRPGFPDITENILMQVNGTRYTKRTEIDAVR